MANKKSVGKVVRVVADYIAYVSIVDDGRILSFTPNEVQNYNGEPFSELQIRDGVTIEVEWNSESNVISRVFVADNAAADYPNRARPADEAAPLVGRQTRNTALGVADNSLNARHHIDPTSEGILRRTRQTSLDSSSNRSQNDQLELHPEKAAKDGKAPLRALPLSTRKFGKILDTEKLLPGDLLLAREVKPDTISKLIMEVQTTGGYHANDSRWTHAAMYVGDGANVIEATFDSIGKGGDVRLTALDSYADGLNALRFRRSRFLNNEKDRWLVCVRALSRLKTPYSFIDAALMWFNVAIQGRGFFSYDRWRPLTTAVICSTLYADAYNEGTRRALGEVSGVCVPAWLSLSDEFDDVEVDWIKIT